MTQKTYKQAIVATAAITFALILAVYAVGIASNGREGAEPASLTIAPSRAKVEKLYAAGEFEKVIPLLKRRLKKEAGDTRSRSLLASSYWQIGEYDKSYAQYGELLEEDPENAGAPPVTSPVGRVDRQAWSPSEQQQEIRPPRRSVCSTRNDGQQVEVEVYIVDAVRSPLQTALLIWKAARKID